MSDHHSSLERRYQQFTDLLVLMKDDGLSLEVEVSDGAWHIYLVQGEWDDYALLALIEGKKS